MLFRSLMVGQGKKLDMMDIIWHEMHAVVMDRRVPIFGALVMKGLDLGPVGQ